MTNTLSPDEDRELIYRQDVVWLRAITDPLADLRNGMSDGGIARLERIADRLESLLSDRAKLEEASPEMLEAGHSYIRSFGGLISTLELPGLYRAMVAALNRSTAQET